MLLDLANRPIGRTHVLLVQRTSWSDFILTKCVVHRIGTDKWRTIYISLPSFLKSFLVMHSIHTWMQQTAKWLHAFYFDLLATFIITVLSLKQPLFTSVYYIYRAQLACMHAQSLLKPTQSKGKEKKIMMSDKAKLRRKRSCTEHPCIHAFVNGFYSLYLVKKRKVHACNRI